MLHDKILASALRLARTQGFRKFTRAAVAKAAGCATGTVNYHFDSIAALRLSVMERAIEREDLQVIAQGLAEKHTLVMQAPEKLRRKAARHLI